ncbi:MAG: hypothetical protein ACPKPY_11010 [Nitrososphaeraceae archaeon]
MTFIFPFNFFFLSTIIFLFIITDNYNFTSAFGQSITDKNYNNFTSQNWSTYNSNEFQLKYPSDWKPEGKISKFHLFNLKLLIKPDGFFGISYEDFYGHDKYSNYDILKQSEEYGKSVKNPHFKNYEIVESNLSKYTIDNHPSAAHIVNYVYEENNFEGKQLEIFSLIDSKLVQILYQSTLDSFDDDLPKVEKIIDSIKFTD